MPPTQYGPYLEAEQVGRVTVIRFRGSGDITGEKVEIVGEHLERLAGEGHPGLYVLNCGRVRQQDSTMLAKLIGFNHKVQGAGGRLALCQLEPDFLRSLDMLKLTPHFNIYDEEQEAVQSFPGGAG